MVKPGYKQTKIGVIPEDWETSSLSAAFQKLEAGVSVNSDNSLSSEYHILKTSAVHDGVVDTAETKPVIPQDYLRLKCPLVKGSIIISRMNTPALVGECGFTKDAKTGTYLPDRLWQIQNFNKSSFDFVWLNYLLNTKQYRDAVRATATGTSNSMKNISKERMLDIEIPRPPINEQENIAAALSEVDELINLVEKQIDKKKAIKQGAIQELLTGKRRLPGFSGEWRYFNLMKNSKVKARIGWQGLKKSEYLDSGYALLVTGTDFDDGRVLWDGCHYVTRSRYEQDRNIQLQNNDILITKDGSLGKAALVQELTKPATLNSGIFVIRPLQDAYDPVFVYQILSSFVFKNFLDRLSAGSTIIHLYQKDVGKFEFLLPPTIAEQKAIAEALSEMDSDIAALENKLTKYRQVKQGMMQQLLTGKICMEK